MTQTAEMTTVRVTTSQPPRSAIAVLATATAIGSLGLAAGGTGGALLATEMTGRAASAGLPLGLNVAGSALGALLISWVSRYAGRTAGLILGYVLGAAGAVVVVAAVVSSFALVLAGSAVVGVASAAVFLTRYVAAEIAGDAARGRALGVIMFGAAVGAVASPNLLGVSGVFAAGLGLPRLTGLYLVAVPSFAVAALLLTRVRRSSRPTVTPPGERPGARTQLPRLAVLVLAITNLVMVAVMAIAPVHLAAHGHGLGLVGGIVSVHVLCMLVPAPLSGWLVDRAGPAVLAGAGGLLLAAAGTAGAVADPHSSVAFVAVLGLLGLGWNAGMVAGSTMLMNAVPAGQRLRVEGVGEVAMGLAAGAGAPVAGIVVAFGGFPTLAIAGAAVALLVSTPLLSARTPRSVA